MQLPSVQDLFDLLKMHHLRGYWTIKSWLLNYFLYTTLLCTSFLVQHLTYYSTWRPVSIEMGRCKLPLSTRALLHCSAILRHRWLGQPEATILSTIGWIWISFSWCFWNWFEQKYPRMIYESSIGYNHSDRTTYSIEDLSQLYGFLSMLLFRVRTPLTPPSSRSLTFWMRAFFQTRFHFRSMIFRISLKGLVRSQPCAILTSRKRDQASVYV